MPDSRSSPATTTPGGGVAAPVSAPHRRTLQVTWRQGDRRCGADSLHGGGRHLHLLLHRLHVLRFGGEVAHAVARLYLRRPGQLDQHVQRRALSDRHAQPGAVRGRLHDAVHRHRLPARLAPRPEDQERSGLSHGLHLPLRRLRHRHRRGLALADVPVGGPEPALRDRWAGLSQIEVVHGSRRGASSPCRSRLPGSSPAT